MHGKVSRERELRELGEVREEGVQQEGGLFPGPASPGDLCCRKGTCASCPPGALAASFFPLNPATDDQHL